MRNHCIARSRSAGEEVEYPEADGEDQPEHKDNTDPNCNGLKATPEDGLGLSGDLFELGLFVAHRESQ
jgi:hypothetical protein